MKESKQHNSHKSNKKKHRKDKHSKKHRKLKKRERSSSPSSSSSSDGEGQQRAASLLSQLERERGAVQAARYILSAQPAVRKSFRELLWELDNGRAVGLSGVPDAVLRSQLQHTLELLGLKSTKGQYWLPSGAPTTLSIIGFVFDEPVKANVPPPPGMMPVAAAAAEQAEAHAPEEAARPKVVKGPQLPPRTLQQQQQGSDMSQDSDKAAGAAGAATPGGLPPAAPGPPGDTAQQLLQQHGQEQGQQEAADVPEEPAPKRRMVGPAAPPAGLLAAAAAYHADIEAAGGYGKAADAEALIGPPPPAFVHEADAAPADAREAQVLRVLRLWEAAAAEGSTGATVATAVAPGAPALDPYAVLGVDKDADNGTIRKTYWRLSLLVHPDKCSHPAAQEVFQAVSKAAQLLQDSQQRAQHDAAQAEAALLQQALAAAAAAQREIAWKRARGEAISPELAAAVAAAQHAVPVARDSWMTDLPTGQQRTAASVLAAGLSQVSQTAFNRFGTRQPGDTSGWTDTPQQRAARAAGMLPAAGPVVPAALAGPAAAVEGAPASAELLAAMAKYNEGHRQKSLLEHHAEQAQQGKQKASGKQKEKSSKEKGSKHKDKGKEKEEKGHKRKTGEDKDADWVGKHPWQPFDRDKDMNVQLQKPKAAADLLKAAGALSSRFSSGR